MSLVGLKQLSMFYLLIGKRKYEKNLVIGYCELKCPKL